MVVRTGEQQVAKMRRIPKGDKVVENKEGEIGERDKEDLQRKMLHEIAGVVQKYSGSLCVGEIVGAIEMAKLTFWSMSTHSRHQRERQ